MDVVECSYVWFAVWLVMWPEQDIPWDVWNGGGEL